MLVTTRHSGYSFNLSVFVTLIHQTTNLVFSNFFPEIFCCNESWQPSLTPAFRLIFRRYFFISHFFLAHFDVGESLWDLGLSNEKLKDQQAVSNKILELENQMDLILVSERFDESLILLKVK